MSSKILVLPGDGIGVEVADQAIRVIDKLNELGLDATYEKELVGGASYDANGEPLTSEVLEKIILSKTITIERQGEIFDIEMPVDVIEKFLDNKNQLLFYPRIPAMVSAVTENSNAEKAGLQKKDLLVQINDVNIKYFDQLSVELNKLKDQEITLIVNRDDKDFLINANVDSNGKLGFMPANFSIEQLENLGYYNLQKASFNFLESFPSKFSIFFL